MTVLAQKTPPLRRFTASVVSAIVVALIGMGAIMLLFFGGALATLGQLLDFFIVPTLIAFVALAVFAMIGIYRSWYLRLIGGLVAGVIAGFLGSTFNTVSGGGTVPDDIVGTLFLSLLGPYLPFVIAITVGTMTAGFALWRGLLGSDADAGNRRVAIVRAPVDTLADGELTHLDRTPIDLELANSQWDGYVAALSAAGWEIVEVPSAPGFADSVFIEDAVVLFGDTAVIGSPGAESRVGEIADAETTVKDLGFTVSRITAPGTLDGGDVLKVGSTVYVGRGGRTNPEGIRQLRGLLAPLGYVVVAVPVTKALHLKSAVTALPDGTVIGFPPLVDDPSVFGRFLAVPEAEGVAVVQLSADTLLMSAAAPLSAALVADLGYMVVTVDISEFEKLEGCVTCLSVRVR